jgi:uncharacterized protein HemX
LGQLNYDALRFWLAFIIAVLSLATSVWVWWNGRSSATRANIDAVNTRVTLVHEESRQMNTALRKDIDRLDVEVRTLPDHDDLKQVYERLGSVDRQLSQLVGSVKGVERGFEMINNHLLNKERS